MVVVVVVVGHCHRRCCSGLSWCRLLVLVFDAVVVAIVVVVVAAVVVAIVVVVVSSCWPSLLPLSLLWCRFRCRGDVLGMVTAVVLFVMVASVYWKKLWPGRGCRLLLLSVVVVVVADCCRRCW